MYSPTPWEAIGSKVVAPGDIFVDRGKICVVDDNGAEVAGIGWVAMFC
jgi:hypothetical protein